MTRKKTHDEFVQEVFNLVGDEYSVLGEYKGALSKVLMSHEVCGYQWEISPNHFLNNGNRCPKCYGNVRKDTQRFKEEVYSLVQDEYSVIGEYSGVMNKVLMSHNVCGYEYEVTPSNFLNNGARCPKCASEQKESKLATQLKQYFVETWGAIPEYRECVNPETGWYLPYDIFIPTYNIYIEVQGQQHYKEFGGIYKGQLKDIQKRDRIKRKHAEANGTYIDVDVRKYNVESAINHIESFM